ncbi:MAG TPA: DUF2950 domain-containing protein, partial [Pyrinomonadaceae bacterium]|nr:DUF2950 domain-containing protein [Pyrinomonadaceae bacterium]
VAAAVAVVGGEIMKKGQTIMNILISKLHEPRPMIALSALAVLSVLFLIPPVSNAQSKTGSPTKGKAFVTAQQAADALIDAAEKYDEPALTEVLGPDSFDITHTGEPARDSEKVKGFAAQARAKMTVSLDKTKTRATLIVGTEDWPFPLPIVKVGKSWFFDTKAGRQELLYRRVGNNELDAIQICRGYVEAQHEYALAKKQNGVNQYAQRIISTEGQQDGLAWKNADGTWDGPIGEKVAAAIARGYANRSEPYHGYFFKVLKGQGPAAPLGELDYVIKGVMIGGFALVASPAQYRNTGVKTFIVSQDGVVYEKDLGPKTLDLFQAIDRFNPDKSWTPVSDQPVNYKLKAGWRSTFR